MIPADLEAALQPFLRLYRVQAPLNPPDERPLRDYCPGVWPTMGHLRRLYEAVQAARSSQEVRSK
jgi:hypothetical protein